MIQWPGERHMYRDMDLGHQQTYNAKHVTTVASSASAMVMMMMTGYSDFHQMAVVE
jgi:hypothetical protein